MRKIKLFLIMMLIGSGMAMAQVMENFESLKMNIMLGGAEDQSSFMVVPNPDPTGLNPSAYVVKFTRDKDGVPWGGFYATLSQPVDFDTYAYVHVKVWKSRISPVKFKIEGGATGNIEVESLNAQTTTGEWVDYVFDFTEATGMYSKIVFMPDFLDPVDLTEDITIYFDDLVVNNNPDPMEIPQQTFNVDMTEAGLTEGQPVYISGALGGIHGTWNEPGTNENNLMTDPDEDGIYTLTTQLPDGLIAFKYFKGTGWGSGDPAAGGDRTIKIAGNMTIDCKWAVQGVTAESSDDNVIMEDYESLKMNIMTGGAEDLSKFTVVPNPDPSGNNLSGHVVEFLRDKDGVPWGGFYATLDNAVDFDAYNYVHVKVWKSRISPVKFKIEGGATGNIEIESMNPQTVTNGWEDMVFDFTEATGMYSKIVFMPDFKDPVDLTEDLTIYFDDFVLNNDPEPKGPPMWTINVDMTSAGLGENDSVYIAGALGGIYGTWNEPGTNPNNKMTDPDGDGIFSITLSLADGIYAFKFFKNAGWGGGDNAPGGDRTYTLAGDVELTYKFGVQGLKPLFNDLSIIVDGQFSVNDTIYPSTNLAPVWTGWSGNGGTAAVVDGVCVMTPGAASDFWQLQVNQVGNDNGWAIYNDSTYVLIFDAWAEADRLFRIDFEDNSGNGYKRYGLSPDADALNGECDWEVSLTTEKTTYTRFVTFNALKDNSTFKLNIMPGQDTAIVYIDNIYLINVNNAYKFAQAVTSIEVKGEGDATTIETDKGTLQMNAMVLPEDAFYKGVTWSVTNGTGKAMIDANGVLMAISDGTVTVKATAKDGSKKSGMREITISNQEKLAFPVDFETPLHSLWGVFANSTGLPTDFMIVANPEKAGINTSDNVLKFVVNEGADPWAGAYSDEFAPLEFTAEENIITMMVHKSILSNSGFKVEGSTDGGPVKELKVANTVVNDWELLSFDFSECIGHSYPRIVIFPDFPDTRTAGTTVYIDNIARGGNNAVSANLANTVKIYPNPVADVLNVYLSTPNAKISVYNSVGRMMDEVSVQGNLAKIDVSSYARGVYFVKVNNDSVVKFVK